MDTRVNESVQRMVDETVGIYGHLDVLIYNSGAIWWASVENTPLKRFQLMQRVNPEGLYATIQAALPHFKNNDWKGRIIVVSPPIYSRFFRGKTAYAMGKIGMSVLTKGLAMDFIREGKSDMAITSIWPAAVCKTLFFITASINLVKAIQSAATGDPEITAELRKAVRALSLPCMMIVD